MKKLLILGAGMAIALPLQAQFLSHEGVAGAGFGALTGGIIGHHSGHHGWEGAAIGAGAGFVLGSLIHEERARERYYYSPSYLYQAPVGYYTTYAPSAPAAPAVVETPQPAAQPAAPPPPPAPVSPMAGANSLFGR